ncbi:MAG: hypothetical protein JWP35_4674 [Caulobacter sp.]|nr:hypothetical protein [Caulobacter sp.]
MVQIVPYEEQLNTPSGVTAAPPAASNALGSAISDFGSEAEKVFGKVQSDWDHMSAQDADNKRAKEANTILFTGDGTNPGFYSLNGKNAVEQQPAYMARLAASKDRYGEGLTPGARRLYDEQQGVREVSWQQGMGVHVVKQSDVAKRTTWSETRAQASSDYALYYGHDATQTEMARQKWRSSTIQETQDDGLGDDVLADRLKAGDQDLLASAVKANIYPDPKKALQILNDHRSEMNAVTWDGLYKEADSASIHLESGQLTKVWDGQIAPASVSVGGSSATTSPWTEDSAKGVIGKAVPGATFTSGPRSKDDEKRLREQGQPPVEGSHHSDYRPGGAAAWDVVPPAGTDINQAAADIRKAMPGAKVIVEAGKAGHGPHIHTQWDTGAGPASSLTKAVDGKDGLPDREELMRQATAAAGGDPNREVAYRAEADAYYSRRVADRQQKESRAIDAVQPFLRDPNITAASQIPAGVWAQLPETTKTAVTEHYANGGIGGQGYAKVDDPTTIAALYDMYGKNPEGFAGTDFTSFVGKNPKLTQGTYQQMLAMKAQVQQQRGVAKPILQSYSIDQVMSVATPMLVSAGVDPKKPDGQRRIALFQSKAIQGLEEWKAQNPDKPIDTNAIHQIVDGLMLQVHTDEGWWGKDRLVFEAPPGVGTQFKIPPNARADIVAQYHQRYPGKGEPTEAQIVEAWRFLHNRGAYQ